MPAIWFTDQEAAQLLQVLTQAPIPYNVSQPLIHKVSTALANEQKQLHEKQLAYESALQADVGRRAREHVNLRIAESGEAEQELPLDEPIPTPSRDH